MSYDELELFAIKWKVVTTGVDGCSSHITRGELRKLVEVWGVIDRFKGSRNRVVAFGILDF